MEVRPEGYNERTALRKIENIYNGLREVFDTARREKLTPAEAADRVAEQRLMDARKRNGNPLMDATSKS